MAEMCLGSNSKAGLKPDSQHTALNLNSILAFYIWLFDCIQFTLLIYFKYDKHIVPKPAQNKEKGSYILGDGTLV